MTKGDNKADEKKEKKEKHEKKEVRGSLLFLRYDKLKHCNFGKVINSLNSWLPPLVFPPKTIYLIFSSNDNVANR